MRREHLIQYLAAVVLAVCVVVWFSAMGKVRTAHALLADGNRELERARLELKEAQSTAKSRTTTQPALSDAEVLELARLRNEVTRLRNEQRDAAQKAAVAGRKLAAVTNAPPVFAMPPVTTLTANLTANVGLGHALAFGGWSAPTSGKRIVGLITPDVDATTPGAVMITTRLIEFPDAAMEQLGLQGLRTSQTNGQAQAHFTAEQLAALVKWAEQTDGVDMLAAPRIITRSGQAAQVAVQAYSDGAHTGPVINLTPTLDATGTSIRLDVGFELNLPAKP